MLQSIRHFGLLLMLFNLLEPNFVTGNPSKDERIQNNLSIRYKLVDLGECDVPENRLQRNSDAPTLAPIINNAGQIIGNRSEGGFLRDPILGEWVPYTHDVLINFHDLTNNGDLLVSLNRKSHPTEWMIWPSTSGKNGPRQPIQHDKYTNTQFVGLTNLRMAIGNAEVEGKLIPITWKSDNTTQPIEDPQNKNQPLYGHAKSINNSGQVVGFFKKDEQTTPPASWSQNSGVQFMKNFRTNVLPDANAELIDLLIADDGTVYGTYQVRHKDSHKSDETYTYSWMPFEGGSFKLLDLDGMRISNLNDWHTLVGKLDGEAMICEPGRKPSKLSQAVRAQELNGWKLLEATSINNWGDIVGYGKYNGHTHAFLLQKENSQAPYLTFHQR